MVAWTKFHRTDGQSPDGTAYATIRKAALAFNAQFIRSNQLQQSTRVTVHCDPSNFRLGLKFHADASDQDSYALTSDGGGSSGCARVVQIAAIINQHNWLRSATKLNTPARRCTPIWDKFDRFWIVNIRPSFENKVSSRDEIEPGICGIYRYWANGQIVYIGRGDIRSRASSVKLSDWVIDSIEFSVVNKGAEQEKWESLWLDEYRNEHGVLPLYNRIGGKRNSADVSLSQQTPT